MGPPDKIIGLNGLFQQDSNPKKINLGVGAYRGNDGKPMLLPSVNEAENRINKRKMEHEYAGIAGVPEYVKLSLGFAYGDDSAPVSEGRVAAVQTLSGTGACRVAGEFFGRFVGKGSKIFMPNPTWGNHIPIMKDAGLEPAQYKYYKADTCSYDHHGFMGDIAANPDGSIYLIHACAHNPTGCDPSQEEWRELSKQLLKKKAIVFFDCAYQGFASGSAEKDAFAIRQFVNDGHNIMLAQSFAKNFGLYGERIGTLSVVCKDTEEKERVESQLKIIIRPMYSNPPLHGARIVQEVLSDAGLSKQWAEECADMSSRIIDMRQLLRDGLAKQGSTKDWSHITDQIGMFAFTGLTTEQVLKMRSEYSVYCTDDGRISIAGINSNNVEHLAMAIHEVSK
jgi:aspartate aminotransferase